MIVLGIETSCDETAVAVVDDQSTILAHSIYSQIDQHIDYRGVVPELAARSHLQKLPYLIHQTLDQSQCPLKNIDAIAVTAGPGLIGGVIVGVMAAKAIAAASHKPIIAVNHLEAHILTIRLTHQIPFPFLCLLISGGHGLFVHVKDLAQYDILGQAIDDAAGEAFDKVAKLLDLGFPGGPAIEKAAVHGNPKAFDLPRPLKGRVGCDLSFAGLKTAVLHQTQGKTLSDAFKSDMAASFQASVADCLQNRTGNALMALRDKGALPKHFVIAGGVAANKAIRQALEQTCHQFNVEFCAPPIHLCTDNAVMIAWAGIERLQRGLVDNFDFKARPRWGLDELKSIQA